MRLRSRVGAVLSTAATVIADRARLSLRSWAGDAPARIVIDRSGRLTGREPVFEAGVIVIDGYDTLHELFARLFAEYGLTSVLVEAGPTFLSSLLREGLWDALRVETSPCVLGADGAAPAPQLPHAPVCSRAMAGDNELVWYSDNPLFTGEA